MPFEPRIVWMPGAVRTEVNLGGGDTGGAFCLLVDQPPAGWSLPAHLHRGSAETIHMVEGEFEIDVDGHRSRLVAGQTVHVPPGVVHAGGNVGAKPGRQIVIFSPARMEKFFLEAGAPTEDGEVDPGVLIVSSITMLRDFGFVTVDLSVSLGGVLVVLPAVLTLSERGELAGSLRKIGRPRIPGAPRLRRRARVA